MKDSLPLRKLVPALVLVSLASAAPPATGAVGDSATGAGTNETGDSFDFTAAGGPGDSATGTMQYTSPVVSATAVVDCLRVVGTAATVGGTITASSNLSFVGIDLFFYVHDNGVLGAPNPDAFEEAFQLDPTPCHDPTAGFDLTTGEIEVVSGSGGGDDNDDDDQGEDNNDQGGS
jgi:hypothetical protein